MATLSNALSIVKPLCFTDAQKRAYTIFKQCLNHLDNQFGLLYLLDAENTHNPDQSVFLGSIHDGEVGGWYHDGLDVQNAYYFIMELAKELDRDDKLQRLCMMVYSMDSTMLTTPDFKTPEYSFMWEIKDGTVHPSAEEFFAYDDTLFETAPGPEMVDGVMVFQVPEPNLLVQKEKEAARQFADDLARDFFFGIVFTNLPDGLHRLSIVNSMGEVALQLLKTGSEVRYGQNVMSPNKFVTVLSDFIFRDMKFHFVLRASAIADPAPYVTGKAGYELDKLDSTVVCWKFAGKYIKPMNAQETIDFVCVSPDGKIFTPPKNFSYIDAWVQANTGESE